MHLNKSKTSSIDTSYYFGVYALIIGAYLLVSLLRLLLVSLGSLEASAKTHQWLLASIMNSKFKFFDETSFREIISRFSQDLQTVDQNLAILAVATLHFLVALAGIIILIATITPFFLGLGFLLALGITSSAWSTLMLHVTSNKSNRPKARPFSSTSVRPSQASLLFEPMAQGTSNLTQQKTRFELTAPTDLRSSWRLQSGGLQFALVLWVPLYPCLQAILLF